MSIPEYVYVELASEAVDSAIKVIEQLTNRKIGGMVDERDWKAMLYDLKAIGKQISPGDRLRILPARECEYEGCYNSFTVRPSGKPQQYCSNSHRVMAHRKRSKAMEKAS